MSGKYEEILADWKQQVISASPSDFYSIVNKIDMNYCIKLVSDLDLSDNRRALLYHTVNNWVDICYLMSRIYYMRGMYVFDFTVKYTKGQKYINFSNADIADDEKKFIRNIRIHDDSSKLPGALFEAIKRDSISSFEINRLINGKKISLQIIYSVLSYNAENIMQLLLNKYSNELFRYRSPQSWLFIICQYYCTNTAVAMIKKLEEMFPGIVKETKNPWGCNLLWYTFFNYIFFNDNFFYHYRHDSDYDESIRKVQSVLLELGCNPDEKNDLGLSFNLIMENTPEKWKKEVKQ